MIEERYLEGVHNIDIQPIRADLHNAWRASTAIKVEKIKPARIVEGEVNTPSGADANASLKWAGGAGPLTARVIIDDWINVQATTELLSQPYAAARLNEVISALQFIFEEKDYADFLINVSDVGSSNALSFCGSDGPKGKLIPDSDFLSTAGYTATVSKFNDGPDWEHRICQAYWRGGAILNKKGIVTLREAQECSQRFHLCSFGTSSNLINAKLIDIGHADKSSLPMPCLELFGDHEPIESMLQYRYNVDVDGYSSSWAGFFARLLAGSPVLKIKSQWDFNQWYYDRLIPWHNYVPVHKDLSDLFYCIEWLERNPLIARKIGKRGRELALGLKFEAELLSFKHATMDFIYDT